MNERVTEIHRSVSLFAESGSVVEMRIPKTKGRGCVSGYYRDLNKLARDAARYSGSVEGIYFTPNPVHPDLYARSADVAEEWAKNTTKDDQITSRQWIMVDFDPIRPSGISSTGSEHEAALERAKQCREWLRARGFPDPVFADSGNGAHLLYRIDLPNSSDARDLLERCLEALAFQFDDGCVLVDQTTFNASRICKLYGTLAAKGSNLPERPHRYAALIDVPERVECVSRELLEDLAGTLPEQPKVERSCRQSGAEPINYDPSGSSLNIDQWIERHGLEVVTRGAWGKGYKWVLKICPWNPEHSDRAAFIVQFKNGAIAAGCHHQSCKDNDWHTLRAKFEPERQTAMSGDEYSSEYNERDEADDDDNEPSAKRSVATLLVELVADAELFHTPNNEAYATVQVGNHRETLAIKSKQFALLLRGLFYQKTRAAANKQSVEEAVNTLESKALFGGENREIYIRIGEFGGAIYVDLCNDRWEVVEITATGWRVISDPPIRFRRSTGMQELLYPVQGGLLDELRKFVNVRTDDDWMLIKAWLVACFSINVQYPILSVNGEQGSAKSTATKVLRSLVDPNTVPLRDAPRVLKDLMIAAENSHVIAFDNLSGISGEMSDSLCRLATGGGSSERQLYSNKEEVLFEAKRPVIFNGIEELGTRSDLLDRTILISLPSIPDGKRRAESEFWKEFEDARPRIFGALLTLVSAALKNKGSVKLDRLPRMADFAIWSAAAFGPEIMDMYWKNRNAANNAALDASPVASAVISFVDSRSRWVGTATELLEQLNKLVDDDVKRQRLWPKASNILSNRLRRLAPNLRSAGVEVVLDERTGKQGKRNVKLEKIAIGSSESSAETELNGSKWIEADDQPTMAAGAYVWADDEVNTGKDGKYVSGQHQTTHPDDTDDADGLFPNLPLQQEGLRPSVN